MNYGNNGTGGNDFSLAHSSPGTGFYNADTVPNYDSFALLKSDGSILSWGINAGKNAPTDTGFTKIYSTYYAFAAMKADGSIKSWGNNAYGAPTDSGYTEVYSTNYAFAAMKPNGSITA